MLLSISKEQKTKSIDSLHWFTINLILMDIKNGLIKHVVRPQVEIWIIFWAVLALLGYRRYRKGLRDIPGPLFASISSLDRIITAASGNQFLTHIRYHNKYGPRVRVGPNHVSLSDGDVIPQIYGITTKFYKVCSPLNQSKASLPINGLKERFL